MTPQEFFKKYDGLTKGYPDDSKYLGECLSIVKLFIKEVHQINPPPSGTNSAYGYWSNFPDPLGTVFEKVSYTSGMDFYEGDIPIWKPTTSNPFGHIDILVKKDSESTFIGFDQNWNGKQSHFQQHNLINIAGCLRAKKKGEPVSVNLNQN